MTKMRDAGLNEFINSTLETLNLRFAQSSADLCNNHTRLAKRLVTQIFQNHFVKGLTFIYELYRLVV